MADDNNTGAGNANTSADVAVVPKAEFERVKTQMQNWMAKATDYEKRFGSVDIDALKAKAEERDILAAQLVSKSGNAEGIASELQKARQEAAAATAKEWGAKLSTAEKTNAELQASLKRLQVIQPAMLEAAKRFSEKELDLVQMLVEKDLDLDGDKIVVKGKDGPRLSSKRAGEAMTLEEYFGELTERYPNIAKASDRPGTGMRPSSSSNTGTGSIELDPVRISAMPDKGAALFQRLSKENPEALKAYLRNVKL